MAVKYAVQILSKTMPAALPTFETLGSTDIAEYCELIELLFNCLNVQSLTEGNRKIKLFFRAIFQSK